MTDDIHRYVCNGCGSECVLYVEGHGSEVPPGGCPYRIDEDVSWERKEGRE